MEFRLDTALPILQRTPGVLRALLTGLPADWIAWRAYLSILAPRAHNV